MGDMYQRQRNSQSMNESIIKIIFGVRGCGKSETLKRLIKEKKRLIIYDRLHEYSNGIIFYDFKMFKQFWANPKVYQSNFRLIYRPGGDIERRAEEIGQICKLANYCEDLTIAIEELNILFLAKRPPAEFNELVFGGRHANVEIIGAAQRPKGFPDLVSQAKELYIFQTRHPDDVKYFSDFLGKEYAKTIQELQQYHYLRWYIEDGQQKFEVKKDSL